MPRRPSTITLARSGNIDACCSLANDLLRADTSEAYRAALPWLRRIASVEPWAAYHIGLMFNHGKGLRRSIAKAITWYTKAAQGGYDSAQLNLGIIYANLPGKRRDLPQALALYRAAARQGNRNAMYNLGYYYELGRGVRRSRARAIQWYKQAASKGDRSAKARLRRLIKGGV